MAESVPTFALWTGDGSTTQFSFSFPYQQPADVFVTVDGSPVTTVFVTSQTIQITPAPAVGAEVRIFRSTPAEVVANNFQLGAPFLPENIDENFEQSLFILQEGLDAIDLGVGEAEQAAEDAAATAAAIQVDQDALAARTLRAPEGEIMPAFPPAAARAGQTLVFDGNGDPVLTAGSDASSLAAALADWNQGGNLVGYDATRSVTQAIDEALAAGVGEILIEDVTGLQTELDGKSDLSHTHILADVTDNGDAAYQNIGTAGATVPLCQNNTTWGFRQTLVGAGSGARLDLQANAGTFRDIVFRSVASPRWNFGANSDPESGENAGSNFELTAFSDFGGEIGKAVQVRRADGATLLNSAIGGYMGDGTLNAKGLFVNGANLAGIFAQGPSVDSQGRLLLPSGLELKWGRTLNVTSHADVSQNFALAFPNKAMVAQVTVLSSDMGPTWDPRCVALSTTGITVRVRGGNGTPATIMWFVVGH